MQTADQFVRATTGGKLQVIVDQIRFLQEQARRILEDGRRDSQLHHAACNFQKVPGHTYHLYEREDGSAYFSMLGPQVCKLCTCIYDCSAVSAVMASAGVGEEWARPPFPRLLQAGA